MSNITLEQAEEQLNLWLKANQAISSGVSYTIGSRSLTRVNSSEILKQIEYWDSKVTQLKNQNAKKPTNRIYRAVPLG